ncbi:TetR/AcrR family transcriptional regulator [Flavimaricola marinus]|uniref:Bacterial regulatory proteins, tetR family n=1 Tax=Flavimaricola marinus TaxID=1819565 RepID=A0A238LAM5_9RHOB|nr:TetR/AcrR family transcriptional regulator [Flavimaricola marinus]SMY06464.1 Bacterial regulatory proteins, tetR family [Flavimaricola marinus]
MTDRRTLTPQDWIDAAFRALTDEGPKGIRAEALARSLQVSKGSFYWHFADVPALKSAMLAHWEAAATDEIAGEADASPPADRIRRFVEAATADDPDAYGGRAAEPALREWGRADPAAAEALARVESRRLGYLKDLMLAANAKQPGRAARLLYAALIGMEALPRQDAEDTRKDLTLLLKRLLP